MDLHARQAIEGEGTIRLGSPLSAGGRKLAGRDPRRQTTLPGGESLRVGLAAEPSVPQGTPRARHHAGHGNLSP
jgi:hypothetical protein